MNQSKDKKLKGISEKYRFLLAQVLRNMSGCITAATIHKLLDIPLPLARVYLSRWANSGWLQRIRYGVYVPLDLEAIDVSSPTTDAWVVAQGLFSPCYVGGWSAAQYWDFTEQIFNQTLIISSRSFRKITQEAGGHCFIIKKTTTDKIFGVKTIWKDNVKIAVSDPHKTIIDILDNPVLAGGIRSTADFLKQYIFSSHKDMQLVLAYAERMNNRTIFKRLGYLLSILNFEEQFVLDYCKAHISQGYSQLDPTIKGKKINKKWGLWLPEGIIF